VNDDGRAVLVEHRRRPTAQREVTRRDLGLGQAILGRGEVAEVADVALVIL
jgi:hypothetical protein